MEREIRKISLGEDEVIHASQLHFSLFQYLRSLMVMAVAIDQPRSAPAQVLRQTFLGLIEVYSETGGGYARVHAGQGNFIGLTGHGVNKE